MTLILARRKWLGQRTPVQRKRSLQSVCATPENTNKRNDCKETPEIFKPVCTSTPSGHADLESNVEERLDQSHTQKELERVGKMIQQSM